MKQKCSFILKASLSLVLALLMLFGTVATSLAAVVDNADTGAEAEDIADTGADVDIVDEGADVDLAETATDGSINGDGSKVFIYMKDDACQTGWWSNDGAVFGLEFSTDSNGTGATRVNTYTTVSIGGSTYWRFTVPSGAFSHVKVMRLNPSDTTGDPWNWGDNRIPLHTDDNCITKFWNNGSVFTWGDDIIEYPSTVSVSAPENYLAANNTSTVTLSSSYTNSSYISNASVAWTTSDTTNSSIGSSTGVFKAKKSGTYTVTATLSYKVKGYSDISQTSTKTYNMHAGYPAGTRLLVKPSGGALDSTPNWGVHLFNDNVTGATLYADVTECTTGSGYYYIDIPAMTSETTCYTHMQWLRVKAGESVNELTSWDSEKIWNNSGNIVYDSGSSYNCFDYNAANKSGSNTNTLTHTHKLYAYTYKRDDPTKSYSSHATLKNGEDVACGTASVSVTSSCTSGATFDGWFRNSNVSTSGYSTATTSVGNTETISLSTAAVTSYYYAKYTLYNTQITINQTGGTGTTKIGGSSATSKYVSTGAATSLEITPPTGYTIESVTKSSGTAPTWTTSSATSYVGTVSPTGDTVISVTYSEIKPDVALNVFSNGALSTAGGTLTIDGTASANAANTINPGISTKVTAVSSTPASGYTFTGWTVEGDNADHIELYTNEGCTTAYTAGGTNTTIYIKTDGTSGLTTANAIIKAHFQKVHYLSLYNTTTYDRGRWIVVGAPPQQVKVTGANGVTKTYKYKAGTEAERGEDSDHGETDLSNTTNKHIVNTNDTFYYEGNLLQYYAGDKIELVYSSLASSDTISSVSYNNDIRYTTEPEDDNLYKERVYKAEGYWIIPEGGTAEDREPDPDCDDEWEYDYEKEHCLYATPYYYVAPHKTTIEHVISSEGGYLASINDETHTVTFTAGDQNYLNIDIELAMKKQIFFSDYDNTVISHVNADDYYDIGEDISPGIDDHPTNCLTIKAKGDDGQTNTITAANIKLYYCNVNGEYINPTTGKKVKKENRVEITDPEVATITVNISEGTSIANSGDTDSTAYIYFGGTMPATDVYVDLNLTVSYTLTLKSKILSDTAGKTAFGQVANLYLGTNHEYLKNDACTTSTTTGPETCNAGSSIALRVTEITSGYMFVGWFTGNSSGPNLDSQPLSTSETFSYKPTATTYIWAVGTRDLYINGAAELFNVTGDWNAGGTGKNLKMKFDPNQGTAGVYYYEITETVYKATTTGYDTPENTGEWVTPEDNSAETDAAKGYKESSGYYYWMSRADSVHGNAFFQILDTDTFENDTKSVWAGIDTYKTDATTTTGVTIGKALPRGYSDGTARLKDGQGFISFSETANEGFSYPIRIYYDPNGATDAAKVYAKATPIYPHIYISNGYKMEDPDAQPSNVTFTIGTDTTNVVTNEYHADGTVVGKAKYKGNGWVPGTKKGSIEHGNGGEGRINDYIIQERNTTLHLKKSVTDATNYKVSNFLVYNITKDSVKAYPATRDGSTANYTCDITTHDAESMYIVPIVEYIGSAEKMTVIVDATQVDTTQWGDLISCYAWYSDDSGDAYGKYPGQLMVPSDDGLSWKATFPVKKPSDTTKEIVGITFANYVNASSDPKTWLDDSGVMGTVTTDGEAGTGNIIPTYNLLVRTGVNKDGVVYNYGKTNFKAQTYDYREPIAFYKNKPTGSSSSVLTFALKQGDGDVIGWTHTDLVTSNIKDYIGHATWPVDFEYLTDSTGKKYADLNGYILPDKPTTSFYIVAKGMVSYKNNAMTYNFWSGANYQTPTGSNPSGKGGFGTIVYKDYSGYSSNNLEMKYAVQWYVYDASGNYITNVLSAGFADQSLSKPGTYTVIAKRLTDLGYAVEGRSAAICYDVPRSCYNDSGSGDSLIPNADSSTFNCYRFTGQWYQDNEYKNAKVYAKVGIMTDNGEDIADSSSAAYGSASVSVNNTLCTVPGHDGTDTDEDGVDYGYTTVTDGDKGAITLTATSGNFIGWYHYNVKNQLELDTTEASFRPSYSADSTYIALYKAKVNYRYQYTGREGGIKYYNVPASSDDNLDNMSADEIADGNKVKKDSTHSERVLANNPTGAGISIFKKTINFNGTLVPETMFNNDLEYVLTVNNSSQSVESYSVTAIYNTDDNTFDNIAVSKQYNQAIDLTKENGGTPVTNLWSGHRFIGWYEYNTNTDAYGNLLSTQANYGLVCTKAQTIRAVYTGDGTGLNGPVGGDAWEVFIDDYGPTYEKTSSTSGDVYCDAIVRVRKNNSNLTTIADGGRVGMLIVDDNGTNETIKTENLGKYAAALSASNGTSGNVSVTVGDEKKTLKITNLFSTSVNSFGRVDLAAKYGYANVTDQKYHIYAYYFVGGDATNKDNYIFSNTTGYASGTYS